jgi:hypothetical protein
MIVIYMHSLAIKLSQKCITKIIRVFEIVTSTLKGVLMT